MPRKQIQFSLDFITNNVSTVCTVKQFDDVSFKITPLAKGLPYNLQNMTYRLFVGVNKDLFMQITNITLSENKINIILDKNILQNEGTAYAELELSDSEGVITSSSFIFNINSKIGNGANIPGVVDDFVTQYEKLVAKFRREVDNVIQKLDGNELVRISSEDIRVKLENERILSETIRSQDEEVRKSSEISRTSNEQARVKEEGVRVKSENTRISSENIRVENENTRKGNESTRVNNENTRITEHKTRISNADKKISDVETRFQTLTANQQQDSEIIDSRDGEISLKARLDRDLAKGKIITQNVEGNYISLTDAVGGSITGIEILGNTVQNSSNLADIQSVGTLREDGLYEMSILSCGKNLIDLNSLIVGYKIESTTGEFTSATNSYLAIKDYIKVNAGKSLKLRSNYINNLHCVEYDINFKFIRTITNAHSTAIELSSNCAYVRVYGYSGNLTSFTKEQIYSIFLYPSDETTTTYEPYQGNKSSILLPCQLEKVGDVSDRLFRREDGIWCVEKNIGNKVLNGSEGFYTMNRDGVNTVAYQTPSNFSKGITNSVIGIISNKLEGVSANTLYSTDTGKECICVNNLGNLQIRLNKTRVISTFAEAIKTLEVLVKYQLATPQIIELPLDTQIQLNSFLGTTHIFTENTVIEPTIKATIPKSLGASVQSLNDKTDILSDRVEAVEKLKEGSELEVTTDKGYVVCENTNNGQIEGLKIEGNTLVNLLGKITSCSTTGVSYTEEGVITFKQTEASTGANPKVTFGKSIMEVDKTYTLIFNITKNTLVDTNSTPNVAKFNLTSYNTGNYLIPQGATGIQVVALKQPSTSTGKAYVEMVSACVGELVIKDCIVLEGDHTQNIPGYFEGLKSVGDRVDKIEVLSRKEDGNLINKHKVNYGIRVSTATGEEVSDTKYVTTEYIPISSNTKYISDKLPVVIFFDGNKKIISAIDNYALPCTFTTPTNCRFIRLRNWTQITSQSELETLIKSSTLAKNSSANTTEFKQNKKQILIQNLDGVYEKPILRSTGSVSDTIEKHSDGKYYYHKRCEEIVFDGSKEITTTAIGSVSSAFIYTMAEVKKTDSNLKTYLMCDRFPVEPQINGNTTIQGDLTTFCVCSRMNTAQGIYFYIPNSYLSSLNLEGFNAWLQSNPTTVIYQLATEEVYECVNLDLDSYEGETSVIYDGGVISPKITFKIASHIANTISVLKDRINYLENKVIGMFKYALAGNVQSLAYELYPEDFGNEITTEEENTETVEGTELL